MAQRLLELIARLTTSGRYFVIVGLVVTVVGFAFGIARLERDPSPNNLRAAYGGQQVIEGELKRTFGDTDRTAIVVIEAPNVLEPGPLAYLHELSVALGRVPGVVRVDSLTRTPLPHRSEQRSAASAASAPPPSREDADLEAAIAGAGEGDELEAAIAGAPAPASSGRAAPPDVGARILPLVEGDVEHFPHGLRSLAERAEQGGLRGGPVVAGDTVTAAERRALLGAVQASPRIAGRLVSADHRAALIAAALDPARVTHEAIAAVVADIDAVVAAHPPPAGVAVSTGGLPHLRGEIVRKMERDQRRVLPAAFAVCVLLLVAAFRWWPGVLFPLVTVGSSALLLLGLMGFLGAELNIVNNILPTLLVITCISDSIHLVARYRFEIQQGRDQLTAVRHTVHALTFACFLTSLTNAIGFASLGFASTPMLREFGLLAAGGVMLAYGVTIVFLPASLMVAPPPRLAPPGKRADWAERLLVVVTRRLVKRPWPTLVVSFALLAPCLWATTQIDIDMRLLDMFGKDDQVYRSTRLIEDKFQGIRPLEIALRSTTPGRFADPEVLAALDEVKAWAATQPGVLGTFSHTDILHEVSVLATGDEAMRGVPFRSPAHVEALIAVAEAERAPDGTILRLGGGGDPIRSPLARYVSTDRGRARITVMLGDVGAKRSMALIDTIDARLRQRLGAYPDVAYDLTGEAYQGSFGINAIVTDLFYGLLASSAVIFVLLALLFRSPVLGLASVPPNVMPLFGTLGYMLLRGIDLTPANVIIFAISVGLGVSATVHVLARYRLEVVRGLGGRYALVRAARSTGTGNLFTAFIVALGFSVLSLSSFVTIRQFGELIAITVLVCLGAAVAVLPALLAVAAPWLVPRSRPPAQAGGNVEGPAAPPR